MGQCKSRLIQTFGPPRGWFREDKADLQMAQPITVHKLMHSTRWHPRRGLLEDNIPLSIAPEMLYIKNVTSEEPRAWVGFSGQGNQMFTPFLGCL